MTKVSEITSRAIADMIEYYKPVGSKIEEIDAQLATMMQLKETVSAKQAGFSLTDGSGNLLILQTLINAGYKIIVDELYPLSIPETPLTYTKAVNIYGLNKDKCGFIINTTTTNPSMFTTTVNNLDIFIDNITITTTLESSQVILFNFNNTSSVIEFDRFIFTNCFVSNSVSVIKFFNPTTFDYTNHKGIKYIEIKNNHFENILHYCFNFLDMKYEKAVISNNYVHNLFLTLVYIATNNVNPYSSLISSERILTLCENNTVINDDDFWSAANNSTYKCFVLVEGKEVIYRNNHVEGIHSNYPGSPTYDCYLSCQTVHYENNTWKNNLNLDTTQPFESNLNTFIKAKEGGNAETDEVGVSNRYRYIKNNTFIAEKDFASRVGVSVDAIRVKLSANIASSNWFIENNTFIAYKMMGDPSSSQRKITKFNKNTMEVDIFEGVMFIGNNYTSVSIRDNDINIKSGDFMFTNLNSNNEIFELVNISNNSAKVPLKYILSTSAKKLVFNGNYIHNIRTDRTYPLFIYANIDEVFGKNNTIIHDSLQFGGVVPLNVKKGDLEIARSFSNYQFNGTEITDMKAFATPAYHSWNIKAFYKGQIYEGILNFSISVDANSNVFVNYTDESGVAQSKQLNTSGVSFSDSYIKTSGNLSTIVRYALRYNAASDAIRLFQNVNFGGVSILDKIIIKDTYVVTQ